MGGGAEKGDQGAKPGFARLGAEDGARRPSGTAERFAEEPIQLTMNSVDSEVLQKLRALDVNTLTPIECMNALFELHNMLK